MKRKEISYFPKKKVQNNDKKPNKFIMKIFVISLIPRSKEFLASFNNP